MQLARSWRLESSHRGRLGNRSLQVRCSTPHIFKVIGTCLYGQGQTVVSRFSFRVCFFRAIGRRPDNFKEPRKDREKTLVTFPRCATPVTPLLIFVGTKFTVDLCRKTNRATHRTQSFLGRETLLPVYYSTRNASSGVETWQAEIYPVCDTHAVSPSACYNTSSPVVNVKHISASL